MPAQAKTELARNDGVGQSLHRVNKIRARSAATLFIMLFAQANLDGASGQTPTTGKRVSRSPRCTRVKTGSIATDRASTGGVSWVDYDDDGDVDLFVTNGYDVSAEEATPQKNKLYKNNGDGTFTSITTGPLVTDDGFSSGSTWGDYDNDGDLDVFVSNQRGQENFLYSNNGDATFQRVTGAPFGTDKGASFSSSWVDVDNDGHLDLFVANGGLSALEPNFLYRGNGDGTFTKITDGDIVTAEAKTGGAVWGDYDNDGDADLFVPNGNKPDVLYRNDGKFTFTAMPTSVIEDDHRYSIAGAWGDYDNDGYLDLYVANMYGGANTLFHNKGDGTFERVHTGPPVVDGGHSYAVSWSDWDNDGYLDLLAGNWGAAPVPYLNESGRRFVRADAGDLGTQIAVASSIAWADFDNDGDVDVCLGSWPNSPGHDERNMLYRNEGTARSWLKVRLRGTKSNRAAIGARLTLRARIHGRLETQIREVVAHSGWRSQSDLAQHFGLGDAKNIEEIVVRWPSGSSTRHTNIKANQIIEIVESP